MRMMRFAIGILLVVGTYRPVAAQPLARVLILATLHRQHEQVAGYDLQTLARVLEALHPTVLLVELSPEQLSGKREFGSRIEYSRVILPYAREKGVAVLPLEPAELIAAPLLDRYGRAEAAFARMTRESTLFGQYLTVLTSRLHDRWLSAAEVNDATTDALFAVKHAFQDAVCPQDQAAIWAAWNSHFLLATEKALQAHPEGRIVVTVGAEHAYWLRGQLRLRQDVILEDAASVIRQIGSADRSAATE
jgi:hypothetical protein